MGRQPAELMRAIGVVSKEPAQRWLALCRGARVIESLDHGRKSVCPRDSTVQMNRVPPGVLLDRLRVLVDGVGCQVLQFQTTGVQHRDPSAATTVGGVGTFGVACIHTSLLAEQRDQAPVEEGDAHTFTAVNEQQLSKFTIL